MRLKKASDGQKIKSATGMGDAVPDRVFLERLLTVRHTRCCMADWKITFKVDLERVRPCLVKVVGVLAKSYPAPGTALRLVVRETANGYLAHPTGDFDHDCEDLRLTLKDVEMWALDWAKVEEAFGGQRSEIREPRSEGKVNSDRAAVSVRLRAKRVAAGRDGRTVVKHTGDRRAIRAEVQRLLDGGLSKTAAYLQVAEQAQKGRAGKQVLTTKYGLGLEVASPTVVMRAFKSKW